MKDVNYPPVGKEVTAYVGDHMVEKGVVYEEQVLYVKQRVDGALYDIPSKNYPQVGFDEKQDFFSATGVIRGALSDPIEALAVGKEQGSQVCVITTLGEALVTMPIMRGAVEFLKPGIAFSKP